MSARQLMRPAARSAAVRPHSLSFPSPRPASAVSPCFASLFFAPVPRPVGRQSYWLATACSHFGWEQLAGWERVWEQEKRGFPTDWRYCSHVPMHGRARVIRARAGGCGLTSLFLGTWKHLLFIVQYQQLVLFPMVFPASGPLGTWEQSEAVALAWTSASARSNKVEAGYAVSRLPAGDARRKFRAPIARLQAAGALELGRIRSCSTWSRRNGGNLPFFAAAERHVGRLMLEGSRQAADPAAFSGARPKLGRLLARPLAELTLLGRASPPRAPNRGRRSAAMLALHALRLLFETRYGSIELALGGSIHDRLVNASKSAQCSKRRRGPGGARLSTAAEIARPARNSWSGKRAGVSFPAPIGRSHETGEFAKLQRRNETVNAAAEAICG